MAPPYLHRIEVRNYHCVKRAVFPLTPLHAFIGPNDSGKSTLLQAIGSLAFRFNHPSNDAIQAPPDEAEVVGHTSAHQVRAAPNRGGLEVDKSQWLSWDPTRPPIQSIRPVYGARILRLDPDELRVPTGLIPAHQPLTFLNSHGRGLAALCDAIVGRNVDDWLGLRERFLQLFPTVARLELRNADASTKELWITLHDGTEVPARFMSEGMLYWLAFAALRYSQGPALLLIEEPENGLHPSRIRDVMTILRDVSQRVQVVIASHSPLVINELSPDEVSLVTRHPDRGSTVTPMKLTKNFEQRSKVYALGELWLSFADGELERDLTIDDTAKVAG